MATKTFVNGETLTANDVNQYLVNKPPKIWAGKLAAAKALVASNYTSIKPSTLIESTGDLAVTWSGDALMVPEAGWYEITLQVSYDSNSSGNRLAGFVKNHTADSLASASAPAAGTRRSWVKTSPSSDYCTIATTFVGFLDTIDKLILMARSTQALNVLAGTEETSVTVVQLRAGA